MTYVIGEQRIDMVDPACVDACLPQPDAPRSSTTQWAVTPRTAYRVFRTAYRKE
ncbi:MAG: hypothetical protein ACRDVG_03495 [Jatrophihabitantaceae bacterium]